MRLSDGSGEGELKGHAVASAGEARRVSDSRPCDQKHLARPAVRKSLTARAAGPNIPTVGNSSSRESTSDREGSESRPEAGADGGLAPLRCLTTELLVKMGGSGVAQARHPAKVEVRVGLPPAAPKFVGRASRRYARKSECDRASARPWLAGPALTYPDVPACRGCGKVSGSGPLPRRRA